MQLCVGFLVALHALAGCLLAFGIFRLMAIDAGAGGGSGIVEGRLRLGLHRSGSGGGVAVLTLLMCGRQGLLRLGCVMAGLALNASAFVRLVVKLHAAHGSALQDDGAGSCFRRIANDGKDQHEPNDYN